MILTPLHRETPYVLVACFIIWRCFFDDPEMWSDWLKLFKKDFWKDPRVFMKAEYMKGLEAKKARRGK